MATNVLELQNLYDSMLPELMVEESGKLDDIQSIVGKRSEVVLGEDVYLSNSVSGQMIDKVFLGNVESIHLKDYISKEERENIVRAFVEHPMVEKEIVDPNPPIYSIGSHLYSSRPGMVEEDYFSGLKKSNEVLSEILRGNNYIEDFLKNVAARLGLQYERFSDKKGNEVKYGSLRMWGWGGTVDEGENKFVALPHEDLLDISNRFPELDIAKADNVYAAILCLSSGEDPSRTIIWDKVPTREDDLDPEKKKDYVFTPDMIDGVSSYSLQLCPGDLGVFPAHKIHAVAGAGERCTLSCFFHIHEGKLIFRT